MVSLRNIVLATLVAMVSIMSMGAMAEDGGEGDFEGWSQASENITLKVTPTTTTIGNDGDKPANIGGSRILIIDENMNGVDLFQMPYALQLQFSPLVGVDGPICKKYIKKSTTGPSEVTFQNEVIPEVGQKVTMMLGVGIVTETVVVPE